LKLKIGYALRGSRQQKRFERGQSPHTLAVDISFREPIGAIQIVKLGDHGGFVRAYSLLDLIAEKMRALLQQKLRNRFRRQDIYDIDALLSRFSLEQDEKAELHELFLKKCVARNIKPELESLSDPEVIRRARDDWDTLALEIGSVTVFEDCFARVDAFYRSLPWSR
jgi:predicted nucleotidyltransferase component of viral defense system